MDIIVFLLPPLTMCLLLVGIHCYLGIHVLKRDIIFIDLSLAQVASLGSTVALLLHFDHDSDWSYFISLFFTFIASFYFSWIKKYGKKISQEVIIALVYAFSSALLIIVANYLSHGADHIKEIMIGRILWITWPDIIKTSIIYSVVALIHFIYRSPLLKISNNEKVSKSAFWDFLFYTLFGIVITSSVRTAGILLVFSFLIVPALISRQFVHTIKNQLLLGWLIGTVLSFFGMLLSYKFDLPAGAVIVVVFTSVPILFLPLLSRSAKN